MDSAECSLCQSGNKIRLKEECLSTKKVFDTASSYLAKYQKKFLMIKVKSILGRTKWRPLMGEMYRTNFDGAVFADSREAGIRVVICNSNGEVVSTLSEKILYPDSVEILEALAARRAAQFAVEVGICQSMTADGGHLSIASYCDWAAFCACLLAVEWGGEGVKDGMNCPLIRQEGKEPNSPHKIAMKCCEDLKNHSRHIDKLIEKQTSKELENNRLRLKTSVKCARWLAFQACAFRGHDESLDSKNRGNFIELIKFTSTFNDKIASVVLENAPGNAKYTSPTIQKKILHILASNVRNAIREEIGDAKFCILVDEARDESKREQMAIILRFVDKEGFIKERFFHVVHVRDTTALTLKNEICAVLSHYNLHIENIRGQGYDGASNMRGEWNGLQTLFLKECPYAYYVHYMAHRLQLALVTASREVKDVHQFFDHLVNIINIVVGSSKRNDELQHAQAEQVENIIASNEIETGRGANQIGTLQRAGDTRWGSHFQSICSLINMFNATCKVINTISEEGANYKQRNDAEGAYQLRDDGWEPLLASVIAFCEQHEIDIPDMNARYTKGRGRYRRQDEYFNLAFDERDNGNY
nr:uncharacterized protein LOC112040733 [Quercus suber]